MKAHWKRWEEFNPTTLRCAENPNCLAVGTWINFRHFVWTLKKVCHRSQYAGEYIICIWIKNRASRLMLRIELMISQWQLKKAKLVTNPPIWIQYGSVVEYQTNPGEKHQQFDQTIRTSAVIIVNKLAFPESPIPETLLSDRELPPP